jgi:LacI family transcriptional regulator
MEFEFWRKLALTLALTYIIINNHFCKEGFMKNKRVTVEDVARAAGVSIMTVSRAMNNRQGISEQTRIRIQELAREMNYSPSQIARSLATRQTSTLGLVVPDVSNPFFGHITRGVEDAAFENGYSVFLLNSAEIVDRERAALNSLWQKEVSGVILCSSRLPQSELQEFSERFAYMVLVNRDLQIAQPNVVTINVDDYTGARYAVNHLLEMGRRHIALINGPETSLSARRKLNGYKTCLEENQIPFRGDYVVNCLPAVQAGQEAASRLFLDHPDIDAVVAFDDMVAVGVLEACKQTGKNVPGDVAVIGADDAPIASLVQPKVSTLRVNQYEIGRTAIVQLLKMIENKMDFDQSSIIQPELILRETA